MKEAELLRLELTAYRCRRNILRMIKTGDQKRTALTAKFIKERIFGINIIINHQNFYPELLNKIFIQIRIGYVRKPCRTGSNVAIGGRGLDNHLIRIGAFLHHFDKILTLVDIQHQLGMSF